MSWREKEIERKVEIVRKNGEKDEHDKIKEIKTKFCQQKTYKYLKNKNNQQWNKIK